MNLGRTTSTVNIASATYGVALKAAMRLAGAFLKGATTRQTVIILKLPPQADEGAYEAAAGLLVKGTPSLLGSLVMRADVTRRGLLDVKKLDDALVVGRLVCPLKSDPS
ncbi:hypothetical protein ASE04_28135 [Rhizobium sp. Root708]|uniref:hypothetical protein n=1 Tax=Rhizobium sp. Root708 TaxID=1736592 RepID=UPI0006F78E53|nr:hypothetical protein [Rhizobium sp. Root708]KRB58358.1 hypothetical protein ASE04_28135 [Rhizobium sp. Root708]